MKFLVVFSVSVLFSGVLGWGSSSSNRDKVLLQDVKALTLESGKMTTGRRSSPVPQLSCVGGSAGCYGSHQPRTVQCLNQGSDGVDAQWECKATMDDTYQFGRIRVVCEGYDHPDDPYILKGSCGLEYELDYTPKGRQGNSHHGGNRYHDGGNYQRESKAGGFGGLIQFVIVVAIIYFVCNCIRRPRGAAAPGYEGAGYGGSGYATGGNGGGGGGPGFWSGAATGGALGYMFGSRGNTGYGRNYGGGWGSGSGWGSGGGWSSGGSGWSSSRRSGSSSSSRTTSGFGGTGRR